ncbi:hypothetical protein LJC56_03005 [Christensenellaceae bacterium OttesenSCG-928-K19]|nr:hypothetical protein [Christensenellaceae bacterium OttesenSCG-928-K19]
MDGKRIFYREILEHPARDDSKEILTLIAKNDACGFYELCQQYVQAALDSQTWFNGDWRLESITPAADTDSVVQNTLAFIQKFDLYNPEKLLHMIRFRFIESMHIHDELSEEVVAQDAANAKPLGPEHFIHLRELPCWDEITSEVLAQA